MSATTDIHRRTPPRRAIRGPYGAAKRFQWGSAALVFVAGAVLLVLHFAEFEWRDAWRAFPCGCKERTNRWRWS